MAIGMNQRMIVSTNKGNIAIIGLGSNLAQPKQQVKLALRELSQINGIKIISKSSLYKTKAIGGPENQPDYINAVAILITDLTAHKLLDNFEKIELLHGRSRVEGERNSPRTLDLDILLYEQEIISDTRISIPHPRMHLREFVLTPLKEIAPSVHHAITMQNWPWLSIKECEKFKSMRSLLDEVRVI